MSKPRIVKSHTIVNEHISTRNTTIETVLDDLTDQPVFWICKRSDDSDSGPGRSDPPRIKIRANVNHSPSVAGVRLDYSGTRNDRLSFRAVVAKHPEEVSMRKWTNVEHKKFRLGELFADVLGRGEEWWFRFDGEWFVWKETYSARLGACKCHTRDFKLLDDRDRLLAVYINDHGQHRDTVGRLDYFVELDREEEVMCLAVIVGIQERKEQQKRKNAEIKKKREKYDRKHPGIYRSQVPFMNIH